VSDAPALLCDHAAPDAPDPTASLRVALVGNPNSGKSTLFNALTGLRQRVANFPGTTVERVEGSYQREGSTVVVLDLPGLYSLAADSPDEAIALDVVQGRAPGVPASASKSASTLPPCAVSGRPWNAGSSVTTRAARSPATARRSVASAVVMR